MTGDDELIYAIINEVTSRWVDYSATRGKLADEAGCVQAIRDRLLAANQRAEYECAHGHRWQMEGHAKLCPTCGTITFAHNQETA
jgi:hypothetical protein